MTQARTNQAYIVDALRSPTGRRKGGLSHVHAIDLGAHVLKTWSSATPSPPKTTTT